MSEKIQILNTGMNNKSHEFSFANYNNIVSCVITEMHDASLQLYDVFLIPFRPAAYVVRKY